VRALALMVAALCLIIAIMVFLVVRPRRHKYDVMQPGIVAPVSVYLDAENQLHSAEEVKDFVRLLRKHLDGRRTDLIYYADARVVAGSSAYRTLYRFGFRPVDVPHAPLGVEAAKNIVDVQLALHAYQRALLGPPSQEVILVSADRDFLPLIYRLRALEHAVSVWASTVPDAFKVLQQYVGIQVVECGLDAEKRGEQSIPRGSAGQNGDAQAALHQRPMPVITTMAGESTDVLRQQISDTVDLISAVSLPDQTAEERFTLVKQRSLLPECDVAAKLGYATKNRTALWLAHLRALGVVSGGPSKMPLSPGPVSAEDGANHLLRFLRELAAAERLAAVSDEHRVKLTTLCKHAAQSPAAEDDDTLKGLRKHLRTSLAGNPALCVTEMQGLCRTAKKLGILKFDETRSPNVIVVSPHAAP
jgi:hypothetical protein